MSFLKGKTAIITGAGYAVLYDGRCGSIGYGIATAYAKEGANLVITGRNVAKLEKAKAELESKYGIKVLALQADISEGADNENIAKGVAEAAMKEFGRIDVLINNAQASASGVTIQDHTTEQLNLAMYSGFYATFYYMKACYPYLKETQYYKFRFRCRTFRQLWSGLLRRCQRSHKRSFKSCGNRVGKGRNQYECCLSSCLDCTA